VFVSISASPTHTHIHMHMIQLHVIVISSLHDVVTGASPPTDLSAEPASPTSIKVSWTPPVPLTTVAGYQINYQAEGGQDSPVKEGSVDVAANATQYIMSDLQGGLWYTITMFTKSRSTVAGPVRVTLSKFTTYVIIKIILFVLILFLIVYPAVVRVKIVNATALLVS